MAKKYIYAIHAPEVKKVKIGISSDPCGRLRDLQNACPVELVLVGCREGTPEEEKRIRAKHKRLRVREWFEDSILDYLKLTDDPPSPKNSSQERKDRLIAKGHDWFDQKGVPPTARDWKAVKDTEWPSYLTCIRAFGSWDNFIFECGWEPRGRGRPSKS